MRGTGPTAMSSKLGYLLSGPNLLSRPPSASISTLHVAAGRDQEEHNLMRFWQVEDTVTTSTDSDKQFLQLCYNISRQSDGLLCPVPYCAHIQTGYRKFEYFKGKQDYLQLVVPNSTRDTVLEESHAGKLGGHLGENRTLGRIREKLFWPGYAEQVRQWCRTCVRCATRKNPPKTRHGALQSVRTGYPVQMVAVDIMGPLPPSKYGNHYIVVASDYFTRWVEAYATPNQEAITVARKLVNKMFCRFSLPEQLHSDMSAQFESKLIKEMCILLHIYKKPLSSPK